MIINRYLAYSNDAERQALKTSAQIAGINVTPNIILIIFDNTQ